MAKLSKFIFLHEFKPVALQVTNREVFLLESEVNRVLRIGQKTSDYQINMESSILKPQQFEDMLSSGLIVSDECNVLHNLQKKWGELRNSNEYESLHIIPTTRCSLRCDYCFVLLQNGASSLIDMRDTDLFDGLDFFFNNNPHPNPLVTFYGVPTQ